MQANESRGLARHRGAFLESRKRADSYPLLPLLRDFHLIFINADLYEPLLQIHEISGNRKLSRPCRRALHDGVEPQSAEVQAYLVFKAVL
jgi:hypothetical protein